MHHMATRHDNSPKALVKKAKKRKATERSMVMTKPTDSTKTSSPSEIERTRAFIAAISRMTADERAQLLIEAKSVFGVREH